MENLTEQLQRDVWIRADRELVFRFFTDSGRFAKWWGAGSTIDPQVGGKVYIRHPNGVEMSGEVLEIEDPQRIVFSYGYVGGNPIPPGGSRVTIRLEPETGGTRLRLLHEFADAAVRDNHVQGWRFQLSLFANAVADERFAGSDGVADAWFAAWAIPDGAARDAAFAAIAAQGVRFQDRYSMLDGLAELSAHAGAAQRFMPGVVMKRTSPVKQCQGVVLAEWSAAGPDGKEMMRGVNVFVMGPDGRIETATGLS